jgi:hypothetical protein
VPVPQNATAPRVSVLVTNILRTAPVPAAVHRLANIDSRLFAAFALLVVLALDLLRLVVHVDPQAHLYFLFITDDF